MAEIRLGDYFRLRVVCYTSSQVGINTAHFRCTAETGVGSTDQQVADAFDAALAPRYKAAISGGARYRGCSVQRISPGIPTVPAFAIGNDGIGTVAGGMMGTQLSGLVSARTSLAGRRYRGRVYIPFPAEDSNAATGVPEAAYIVAIDDIGDELYSVFPVVNGGNSTTNDPVVWHRGLLLGTPITGWLARPSWATQRRRGAYGRQNTTPF